MGPTRRGANRTCRVHVKYDTYIDRVGRFLGRRGGNFPALVSLLTQDSCAWWVCFYFSREAKEGEGEKAHSACFCCFFVFSFFGVGMCEGGFLLHPDSRL